MVITVEAQGGLRLAGRRLEIQPESVAGRQWTLLIARPVDSRGQAGRKLRCVILAHHNLALSYHALQAVLRCGATISVVKPLSRTSTAADCHTVDE